MDGTLNRSGPEALCTSSGNLRIGNTTVDRFWWEPNNHAHDPERKEIVVPDDLVIVQFGNSWVSPRKPPIQVVGEKAILTIFNEVCDVRSNFGNIFINRITRKVREFLSFWLLWAMCLKSLPVWSSLYCRNNIWVPIIVGSVSSEVSIFQSK